MDHYNDWYIEKNWDTFGAIAVRPNDPTSIALSNCFKEERISEPEFPELSDEELEAHLLALRGDEVKKGGTSDGQGLRSASSSQGHVVPSKRTPAGIGVVSLP